MYILGNESREDSAFAAGSDLKKYHPRPIEQYGVTKGFSTKYSRQGKISLEIL